MRFCYVSYFFLSLCRALAWKHSPRSVLDSSDLRSFNAQSKRSVILRRSVNLILNNCKGQEAELLRETWDAIDPMLVHAHNVAVFIRRNSAGIYMQTTFLRHFGVGTLPDVEPIAEYIVDWIREA